MAPICLICHGVGVCLCDVSWEDFSLPNPQLDGPAHSSPDQPTNSSLDHYVSIFTEYFVTGMHSLYVSDHRRWNHTAVFAILDQLVENGAGLKSGTIEYLYSLNYDPECHDQWHFMNPIMWSIGQVVLVTLGGVADTDNSTYQLEILFSAFTGSACQAHHVGSNGPAIRHFILFGPCAERDPNSHSPAAAPSSLVARSASCPAAGSFCVRQFT
jgi:hypothetical protein